MHLDDETDGPPSPIPVALPLVKPEYFVAVANAEIGKVLAAAAAKLGSGETSKSVIYGLHTLFMKARGEQCHPDGFAANLRHQNATYGTTEHQFRQGQKLLKRANGNFGRSQNKINKGGKKYATERPLITASFGCVRLPEGFLLHQQAKEVAFAAVVLLMPTPSTPSAVGRRIGLVDDEVCSRIAKACASAGVIKRHVGYRGKVWVGRPNANFAATSSASDATKVLDESRSLSSGFQDPFSQPPENHPTGNHPTENQLAQRNWKLGKVTENYPEIEEGAPRASRDVRTAQLYNWRRPQTGNVAGVWRYAPTSEEFQWPSTEELIIAPFSLWIGTLERLRPAAPHLINAYAHAQAVDVSRELRSWLSAHFETQHTLGRVLVGFAGAVAGEIEKGEQVQNFYYLYSRLVTRINQGDDNWLYELPTRLSIQELAATRHAVERLVDHALKAGLDINFRELSSTEALEQAYALLRELGRGDVLAGLPPMLSRIVKAENKVKVYSRWADF